MGACDFINTINAPSAQAGFKSLVEQAEDMYGYDRYNGTISTTSLRGSVTKVADKYSKTAEKKAFKIANERLENCSKWECRAIDCGIVEYRVTSMKKDTAYTAKKGAAKYLTRFVICDWEGHQVGSKTYSNQTEAKNALMALFKKGEVDHSVFIAKKPVLVSGQPEIACFRPQTKTYKSRPKSVPKDAILEEIHHYLYYGWASC